MGRHVAFVEQGTDTESDLRVVDVVGLGRTPFRDRWRGPDATDRAVIAAALARTGLTELTDRYWKSLSGGERQRTHVARAMAQRSWSPCTTCPWPPATATGYSSCTKGSWSPPDRPRTS
ncbi:ABC transporter ATP-binding protein [Streptomyces sp. NPDC002838]|uniref:ABC transporter ATP-binding protein n=1 Tax=Streptomyces sp. NPDC002838 TaxID=3154436 RepID=UPI0033260CCD